MALKSALNLAQMMTLSLISDKTSFNASSLALLFSMDFAYLPDGNQPQIICCSLNSLVIASGAVSVSPLSSVTKFFFI